MIGDLESQEIESRGLKMKLLCTKTVEFQLEPLLLRPGGCLAF